MRNRQIGILAAIMGVAAVLGCTPVQDGLRTGVEDGVTAATATAIEEIVALIFAGVTPEEPAE